MNGMECPGDSPGWAAFRGQVRLPKLYVAGFLFDAKGSHVALVRKTAPEWQAGKLNGIGGKVEPGESPSAAMVREFREEAGVEVNSWRPFCELGHEGIYKVFFYKAFDDEAFSGAHTAEREEVVKIDPRSVGSRGDIIPNLAWLVPLALDPCVSGVVRVEDSGGN